LEKKTKKKLINKDNNIYLKTLKLKKNYVKEKENIIGII